MANVDDADAAAHADVEVELWRDDATCGGPPPARRCGSRREGGHSPPVVRTACMRSLSFSPSLLLSYPPSLLLSISPHSSIFARLSNTPSLPRPRTLSLDRGRRAARAPRFGTPARTHAHLPALAPPRPRLGAQQRSSPRAYSSPPLFLPVSPAACGAAARRGTALWLKTLSRRSRRPNRSPDGIATSPPSASAASAARRSLFPERYRGAERCAHVE